MKWKKNPVGGRKVAGQRTLLTYWTQKMSEQLPALLPHELRHQWFAFRRRNLMEQKLMY